MTKCPACGVENAASAKFCFNCGFSLSGQAAPSAPPSLPATAAARGARPPDALGLAGFALFLVIAGIVVAANPGIFEQFFRWVREWANVGVPLRPDTALIRSAVLFFGLSGLTGFARAALRLAVSGMWVRAIGDVLSAIASLVFAFLVSEYERFALSGSAVLSVEAIVVGLLIFAYVAFGLSVGFGRRLPSAQARRPFPKS